MSKISFEAFEKMMQYDVVTNNACIEIEFSIDGDYVYSGCCLGKATDRTTGQGMFWYGLVEDGSEAYDYDNLVDFISAEVFHGSSIQQLWSKVTIFSIDACGVEERLPFYLGEADGPVMRPAFK